jgi:hypothetical protein
VVKTGVPAAVITAGGAETGALVAVITAGGAGDVGLAAAAGAVVVGAEEVVLVAMITVVVVETGVLTVVIDAVEVPDVAEAGVGLLAGTDCTTITDATESESVSDDGSELVAAPESKSRDSSVSNGARTPRGRGAEEGIPGRMPALRPTRSRSSPARHHILTSLPASPQMSHYRPQRGTHKRGCIGDFRTFSSRYGISAIVSVRDYATRGDTEYRTISSRAALHGESGR